MNQRFKQMSGFGFRKMTESIEQIMAKIVTINSKKFSVNVNRKRHFT